MSDLKRKALNQGTLFKFLKKQTDPEKGSEKDGSTSMVVPKPTEDEDIDVRETPEPEDDANASNINAIHPNDIGLYIHGQVNIGLFVNL